MGYTYSYDGFTLLYSGNKHNIVKTIIFQLKNKLKKKSDWASLRQLSEMIPLGRWYLTRSESTQG